MAANVELEGVGNWFDMQESDDEGDDGLVEVTVGETCYTLAVAPDDGGHQSSLFAHRVWNGARLLAQHLAAHPQVVAGAATLELGAAAALPSLAALRHGAVAAVITDHPTPRLLEVIQRNLTLNEPVLGAHAVAHAAVTGHLWGTDLAPLRRCLAQARGEAEGSCAGEGLQGGFDVVLVGECLWLHDEHSNLCATIANALNPGGLALVSFSHHIPGLEERDLDFFSLAQREFGLSSELLESVEFPAIFSPEKMHRQFLYALRKPPA